MQRGKNKPESVVDPDSGAYERGMREQRRINAGREAELARKRGDTTQMAGDVLTASEFGHAVAGGIVGDAENLRAMRALEKFGGRVGPALSVASAVDHYRADRMHGMPADEALIKNGGGFVLGTGIGALGAVAGAPAGVFAFRSPAGARAGALLLGYMGQRDGEMMAQDAAEGWRNTKSAARRVGDVVGRAVTTLNDPRYWANGRARQW